MLEEYDSEGVIDGRVLTSDIDHIVSLELLGLIKGNIQDLTGIEDFTALEYLDAEYQLLLTSIDLSHNLNLRTLFCDFSENLTDINVSQNSNLEVFSFRNCNLSNIDVSENIKLRQLHCGTNQLTNLDLSQNPNLELLVCSNNQLNNIDLSQNPNLTSLACRNTGLSNIDLSHTPALEFLYCEDNQLNTLDLSHTTELLNLGISNTQLTTIDLSQQNRLHLLWCEDNQLTTLDFRQLATLDRLRCGNNLLTNLDLRNGNNLNFTEFKTLGNPHLTCIFVDDAEYSTNNWLDVDTSSTFVESEEACDALAILDFSQENNFIVYPNPVVKNKFKIVVDSQIKNVKIYNYLGVLVKQFNEYQENYLMSSLTDGTYIIKIETENGFGTKSIILKN